jgi:hypothetical protein
MSGGLRHLNDEGNGPSHAVGYKSSKKQDSYSLERNQCVCAVEEVCPDLQKPKPKSLDRTVVVRDVEKLHFPLNRGNLRDRKCLPKPRKSFVGLPIAKFFRPFSGE